MNDPIHVQLIASLDAGKQWLMRCGYDEDWATANAAELVGYWVDISDQEPTDPTGKLVPLDHARCRSMTLVRDRFYPSDDYVAVAYDEAGAMFASLSHFC